MFGHFNPNLPGRTISSLLTNFTKPTTVELRAVEIMRRLYTPHTLLTYTDDIHTHSELYTIHGTCVNSGKRVPEQSIAQVRVKSPTLNWATMKQSL